MSGSLFNMCGNALLRAGNSNAFWLSVYRQKFEVVAAEWAIVNVYVAVADEVVVAVIAVARWPGQMCRLQ